MNRHIGKQENPVIGIFGKIDHFSSEPLENRTRSRSSIGSTPVLHKSQSEIRDQFFYEQIHLMVHNSALCKLELYLGWNFDWMNIIINARITVLMIWNYHHVYKLNSLNSFTLLNAVDNIHAEGGTLILLSLEF